MAQRVTAQQQSAAAREKVQADDSTHAGWQHVVAVVAAAAGGAAWVSAVGSAVVGLRLDNAGLPVESVVALMSAEHRFAIGGGYLIAPLFVGLVGFAVDWLVIKKWPEPPHDEPQSARQRRWGGPLGVKRAAAAVPAIVVGSVVGGLLLQPPAPLVFTLQSAALLVIVLGALLLYGHRDAHHHRFDERVIVFVSVILSAGAIALGYEQLFADASFDTADVQLSEGATVHGAYITTTDTAVLLITRSSNDCPAITAVRRDQLEQISIGPTEVEVSGDDSESCTQTEDWRDLPAGSR